MEDDANLITHLLEVEQNAFLITKAAQEDANKLLSEAKARADTEFNTRYSDMIKEIDGEYTKKKTEIEKSYKDKLEDYKKSVESIPQDKDALFSYLKKVAGQ